MEPAEQIAEARESADEKVKNRAALTVASVATLLMLNGYCLLLPDLF